MKAVIIAGGKGERLRPLTNDIPKPMIDVAGKPILLHIVDLFKKFGIKDFLFTLCYLPHVITSFFGDGSEFGVSFKYFYEDLNKPLGTSGGIGLLRKHLDKTFIVTSGDIIREININEIIKFHKSKNSFATINVYKRFGPNPKSMICFNKKNLITDFIERPNFKQLKTNNQSLTTDYVWANGSFYVLEPEIFDYIPKNQPSDFGKDIFPKILAANKKVYAFPTESYFVDIGNLAKLKKACTTFKPIIY